MASAHVPPCGRGFAFVSQRVQPPLPNNIIVVTEQQSEEREMPNLCEAINDLVEERLRDALETGQIINVPDLASQMTESIADLIVCSAPPEEQPRMIAHVVDELGRFVKKKQEAGVGAQIH
jgi:dihydrofolate reductase